MKKILIGLAAIITASACNFQQKSNKMEQFEAGSFGYDLQFLKKQDTALIVLSDESGNAQIALSAKFQGKVFTSTAKGATGKSFGWINYGAFDKITPGAHINATGGEDRFWVGPEGGQFSLFFKPGVEMVYDNWFTPPALDVEPWTLLGADKTSAKFSKKMELSNYSGTTFNVMFDRTVKLINGSDISQMLGVEPKGLSSVAFSTENSITNIGQVAWTKESGSICIWMLDMLNCGEGVTIVVPYRQGDEQKLGPVATTDYFGEIPAEWLTITDKALLLKADGKKRAKIGLSPKRAMPISGCYDARNKVLTLVTYTIQADAEYINQLWKIQDNPFEGDAVNAYNDGPLADGSQMGPFLEVESSSPAAFLAPGATLTHRHNVFHFTGEEAALSALAEKTLNLSIAEITK